MPAQIAKKAMEAFAPSAAGAYHRRLMDAYFAENRTISDAEVLTDLAADVGVDAGGFIRHLVENERVYAAAVIDEHNAAIEQGVTRRADDRARRCPAGAGRAGSREL